MLSNNSFLWPLRQEIFTFCVSAIYWTEIASHLFFSAYLRTSSILLHWFWHFESFLFFINLTVSFISSISLSLFSSSSYKKFVVFQDFLFSFPFWSFQSVASPAYCLQKYSHTLHIETSILLIVHYLSTIIKVISQVHKSMHPYWAPQTLNQTWK